MMIPKGGMKSFANGFLFCSSTSEKGLLADGLNFIVSHHKK